MNYRKTVMNYKKIVMKNRDNGIRFFICSLIFLLSAVFAGSVLADKPAAKPSLSSAERTITLKLPPENLARWYKPENKRQVWLHTMFRLRREMLAMQDYAAKGQQNDLKKWADKFTEDYLSIARMMPQWEKYLYKDKLKILQTAVNRQQHSQIPLVLKKLGKSCMHCHDDYQTITTLLYRSADFSRQTVVNRQTQKTVDYDDVMEDLSDAVNRLNIAIKDGYFDTALDNLKPVKEQLADLSDSCSNCHKKDKEPVQRIIGAADELLPQLEQQLKAGDKSQSGRKLGEFAVKVCARCHAVHRLSSDLKAIME